MEKYEQLNKVFRNQFMQPEITEKTQWYYVRDKYDEIYCYDLDLFSRETVENWHPNEEIEVAEGFGARLSAAGYLDCTDWTIHDTEEEAIDFLIDFYGDEVE